MNQDGNPLSGASMASAPVRRLSAPSLGQYRLGALLAVTMAPLHDRERGHRLRQSQAAAVSMCAALPGQRARLPRAPSGRIIRGASGR